MIPTLLIDGNFDEILDVQQTLVDASPQLDIKGMAYDAANGLKLLKDNPSALAFVIPSFPDMSNDAFFNAITAENIKARIVLCLTADISTCCKCSKKVYRIVEHPLTHDDISQVVADIENRPVKEQTAPDNYATLSINTNSSEKRMLLFLNTEDFRIVGLKDIGFFQYNNPQRAWEVVVAGEKRPVRLKQHFNRNELLALSTKFIQVSQSYIINIQYLSKVQDNFCVFFPPFNEYTHAKVGSYFRKKLIEKFGTL